MEKPEQIRCIVQVFTTLMKQLSPRFSFPKGGVMLKTVSSCLNSLEDDYFEVSRDRIVDYCVCQIYTISQFGKEYLNCKWNIGHSFGKKAIERFKVTGKAKKYYEDKWLHEYGLSRSMLLALIEDRKKHPLFKFIYPEYEDITKQRLLSSDVGYYICAVSTLMWTPFSPACHDCSKENLCKERTQQRYPELYRIRCEEFKKKK